MCKICVEMFRKVRQPIVTEKRFVHLVHSLDWITWQATSIRIVTPGTIGDKPRWEITGYYRNCPVVWTSAGPSGADPNLKYYVKGFTEKPIIFSKAYFWKKKAIKKLMDSD